MHTYLVDQAKAKLGAASWRVGVPFPRGGPILLPAERFNAGTWALVQMNGVAAVDRGGKYGGIFTYGLNGCVCSALVRMRAGVIQRIALNHWTAVDRWKDLVAAFNAGGVGGPGANDTIYLIIAEAGAGSMAKGTTDTIAQAGLSVPTENTYLYARSWNPPVSFGVSLERYGGEVPSAPLAKLPTNVGWAPQPRW